jgi:hypothetical protein
MQMPPDLGRYIQDFLRPTEKELGTYRIGQHYKTLSLTPSPTTTYTFIPNPAVPIVYIIHLHILYFVTIEQVYNGDQICVSFHYKWTIMHHPNRTFSIPLYDGTVLHSSMSCTRPHPLEHYQTYYSNQMSYERFLTGEDKGIHYKI